MLLHRPPRNLFFTGKGGVGKTSIACATALGLADRGKRVLLVSTDPASNLGEVLQMPVGSVPVAMPSFPTLFVLDIDPEAAARAYRERVVGPYRGVLPEAALRSIEEQLSGACTVEIAAFEQFSRLLGDEDSTRAFDHVVFDTAPTGHTLRLLELPGAWEGFLASGTAGASCLGPLAGLGAKKELYAATRAALADPDRTEVILVSRPDPSAVAEAERSRRELAELGITRQALVVNGVFRARDGKDPIAVAMQARADASLASMPAGLAALARLELPLLPSAPIGIARLRAMLDATGGELGSRSEETDGARPLAPSPLSEIVTSLEGRGRGVVMVMGKGGVGKTTIAVAIAVDLARRGHRVHLTTTDPAAHVERALGDGVPGLRVSSIDPEAETRVYVDQVMREVGSGLDAAGRALLEEDLRSPCTEEVAVFRAFARVVDDGEAELVVIDTAPTGHTLLLLDATESYRREVLRTSGNAPEEVRRLLPRLRDPELTKVILVTLPEATPVHEAAALQRDLLRAEITPFAWIVNQSLRPLHVTDPLLVDRRAAERRFHTEVAALATRVAVVPWSHAQGDGRLDLQNP